jgi:hypothetical protein
VRPTNRFHELSWGAIEWLAANRWRALVVPAAVFLVMAFVLPFVNGAGIVGALKFAGVQAGVLVVSALFYFALRRSGLL